MGRTKERTRCTGSTQSTRCLHEDHCLSRRGRRRAGADGGRDACPRPGRRAPLAAARRRAPAVRRRSASRGRGIRCRPRRAPATATSTRSSSRRPTIRRSKASRPTCELAWRVARVQLGRRRRSRRSPARSATGRNRIALARAFSSTAARRGRVLCVGESADWRAAVEAERARWSGLEVEEASLGAGARPAARAARVARRGRHRVAPRGRDGRRGRSFRRLARVGRPGLAARRGAGRVLPRRERAGRRRRVRRRRPAAECC